MHAITIIKGVNNILYIINLESETTIAIYSVSGQKLTEIKTHLGDIEISINDLNDGLYIVKLTNNNVSYLLKLIKMSNVLGKLDRSKASISFLEMETSITVSIFSGKIHTPLRVFT